MKRKTLYVTQDVDFEYDLEFSDLLELIEGCDEKELNEIRSIVGKNNFNAENLYDEMKMELLSKAFDKYTLEELQERLGIK